MVTSFTPGAGGANVALMRSRALSASSRCGCSTAMMAGPVALPCASLMSTMVTPGTAAAAFVSTAVSVAPWAGGLMIRACSAPGGTRSPA